MDLRSLLVTLSVIASACVSSVEGQELGAIAGHISHAGGPAKPARLKVDKDPQVCGKQPLYDETVLVDAKGGLANVVASLEGAAGGPSASGTAVVDQKGCRYLPHVQVARVGQELELRSSDPVLHNVHGYLGGRTLFNDALPFPEIKLRKPLREAGVIKMNCDAGHTWMSAYVVVTNHGFAAVSATDGTFRIAGVPPGSYQLALWHEKLGQKKVPVTVAAGADAPVHVAW